MKHIWKEQRFSCVKNGENCSENAADNFQKKITETAHRASSTKGCLCRIFNYVTALVCFCLWRKPSPVAEHFMYLKQNYLKRFHCIFLLCFRHKQLTFFFVDMRIKEHCIVSVSKYDEVDFRKCRSEEWIILLTLSVYTVFSLSWNMV